MVITVMCLTLGIATAALAQPLESNARQGGRVFFDDPNPAGPPAGTEAELVVDGGFEDGTPNPNWNEASTNFGTPICQDLTCGSGGGTGPYSGIWWSWFGGIGTFEFGSVSQDIQGDPDDGCQLNFYLEIPSSSGNGTDYVEALIDGNSVWSALENESGYEVYALVSVDVSSEIDGTVQTLAFESEISGEPELSNFFVDEISLECGVPTPTAPPWAMLVLALMLAGGGLLLWKYRQAS